MVAGRGLRPRGTLLVAAMALLLLGSARGPATAQAPVPAPPTVAGGAFALSVSSISAVLLAPTPAGVTGTGVGGYPAVRVLFVVFGILSVGFWAYFRFRPARSPATASPRP